MQSKDHVINRRSWFAAAALACAAVLAPGAPAMALTGVQVGASGATYASAAIQCALNPETGMGPSVRAGLYNPKKGASATVSLNGKAVATVTFANPDTTVWLASGINTVVVSVNKKTVDRYTFDATSAANEANVCMPDTSGNTITGDLEYGASLKSYAVVTPGCALNAATGRAQPFVNLFDNGRYLLNVSVNNAALTQLNGTTRLRVPVFLAPGLNVISAANGSLSTDYYVRDGGSGTCPLP